MVSTPRIIFGQGKTVRACFIFEGGFALGDQFLVVCTDFDSVQLHSNTNFYSIFFRCIPLIFPKKLHFLSKTDDCWLKIVIYSRIFLLRGPSAMYQGPPIGVLYGGASYLGVKTQPPGGGGFYLIWGGGFILGILGGLYFLF